MFASLALLMPIMGVLLVAVNEAATGNRQLQYLMGLSRLVFWVGNGLWDVLLYLLSLGLVVALVSCFPQSFSLTYSVFVSAAVLYGVSMIALSYWLTFVFGTARSALLAVGCANTVLTFAAMILAAFSSESWYTSVNTILQLCPSYFLTSALVTDQGYQQLAVPKQPFEWDNLGKSYFIQGMFVLCVLLLLTHCELGILDFLCCRCCGRSGEVDVDAQGQPSKDPDVAREENLVLNDAFTENRVLAVKNVVKQYSRNNKVAVAGVSFQVNKNECFGLLGVNGKDQFSA